MHFHHCFVCAPCASSRSIRSSFTGDRKRLPLVAGMAVTVLYAAKCANKHHPVSHAAATNLATMKSALLVAAGVQQSQIEPNANLRQVVNDNDRRRSLTPHPTAFLSVHNQSTCYEFALQASQVLMLFTSNGRLSGNACPRQYIGLHRTSTFSTQNVDHRVHIEITRSALLGRAGQILSERRSSVKFFQDSRCTWEFLEKQRYE